MFLQQVYSSAVCSNDYYSKAPHCSISDLKAILSDEIHAIRILSSMFWVNRTTNQFEVKYETINSFCPHLCEYVSIYSKRYQIITLSFITINDDPRSNVKGLSYRNMFSFVYCTAIHLTAMLVTIQINISCDTCCARWMCWGKINKNKRKSLFTKNIGFWTNEWQISENTIFNSI